MSTSTGVFLGIELLGQRQGYTYAALDGERRLVAIGQGDLQELLFYAAGPAEVVAAISAPHLPGEAGKASKPRPVDLELERLGCHTGYKAGALQRASALYQHLAKLGYVAWDGAEAPRRWLETQAEAAFRGVVGAGLYPAGTLEGRLQRQLVLYQLELPVGDPLDFFEEITRHRLLHGTLPLHQIHTQVELDALMAANVAWLTAHKPEAVQTLGSPAEGVIYLPKSQAEASAEPAPRFGLGHKLF